MANDPFSKLKLQDPSRNDDFEHRSLAVAYILLTIGGFWGMHRAYLGQRRSAIGLFSASVAGWLLTVVSLASGSWLFFAIGVFVIVCVCAFLLEDMLTLEGRVVEANSSGSVTK